MSLPVETHKIIPYSEFYTKTFPLQCVQYAKICLLLSHVITYVLQLFYGEFQGLTLYDLVNYNHTLYHSVFIEICPIVSFNEIT